MFAVAHAALRKYALPPVSSIELVNHSENFTYSVKTADGVRHALRIHRDGYHSKAAIASELAWLIALRGDGVAITPRPVTGLDGELIQQIGHPNLARPRQVVLSEWEYGAEPKIEQHLNVVFEKLGMVTAKLHRHARKWQVPSNFERFTWDFETALGGANLHWDDWRKGMGVDAPKQKLFGRAVALLGHRLAAYGKSAERFGIIHADLRLANLLVDGDILKVIDFDDSGFGWHMYDAATPLSFYEDDPRAEELMAAWKNGYRSVNILEKADEDEIPTFMMMRRLILVAWIGSHAETALAQSMGLAYTEGTVALCENYLSRFGRRV